MKIHIVQKGDTLWELAKQYEVDFNELKEANAHLSSPDMIMPGMKIRIPSNSKQVQKKTTKGQKVKKETKKEITQETKKQVQEQPQPKPSSPKPLGMKEDDHSKQEEVKKTLPKQEFTKTPTMPMPQIPEMPPMMQMPLMDQQVPKHEPIKQEPQKPIKQQEVEKEIEQPVKEKIDVQQEVPHMMPMQSMQHMPVCYHHMPMCCHVMPSCACHHHHQHMMHHMAKGNCCGHHHHMYANPEMGNSYEQPTTMPAQMSPYQGHQGQQAGFYNYGDMQHHTPAETAYHDQTHMHEQSQTYPPFYRSAPESPSNPVPPSFPSMPVDGIDEED